MRLNNKVAIVTGAASGFGEAIAKRFAQEGAKVVIADINDNGAAQVVSGIEDAGGTAKLQHCDVTSKDDVAALVSTTVEAYGRIDIFVNNAGYTHERGRFLDVDEETFERIYDTNVKSIYLSALSVVPHMRGAGGGVILNIASTAGVRPRPGLTWYNGSKGAAIMLTKSMAAELAGDKIRVCAINPVMGETGLLEAFLGKADTPENRAEVEAGIPLGRLSRPEDIANAALYLASDEAAFITGVALEVDGGRCI